MGDRVMIDMKTLPDSTPILVGAGQVVEREAADTSAVELAAQASLQAIVDSGAELAASIDTICVVKTFSDTIPSWVGPFGRSDNPPQSIATRINATPERRIYTQTGGNEPQSRVIEFARRIALGECELVLIAGAETIKNQRHAQRQQRELNWSENHPEPLDDRGFGGHVATEQERKNGLTNVAYYYGLIEQAQCYQKGRSHAEHRQASAQLLESFSQVAANNPYAQFPGHQCADEILAAPAMTHLYTKRMIAQDGVNQGAALLLCSIGKARQLGIPQSKWVFMHGMAEGKDVEVSRRPNPATSPMAGMVAAKALQMADTTVNDIDFIDIYSCFPCAVVDVAEHLGLPTDGSKPLTLTGGLPYFGGPGNNYSMHGIAEAIRLSRANPTSTTLVTTNGGVLSKHASAVYSTTPSNIDWATADTYISTDVLEAKQVVEDPGTGTVVSYTVHYDRDGSAHAIVLADTECGGRFVACTAANDNDTPAAMLTEDPTGKLITVTAPVDEKIFFTFAG